MIREVDTNLDLNNDPAPRKENGPADKIFDELINTAMNNGASYLHIEAFEASLKTRYRIDGQLIEL